MSQITPFTGPFTKEELKHLLRRTKFGLTIDDLNYFDGKTLAAVVDQLLNVPTQAPYPPAKVYYSTVNGVKTDNMDTDIVFGETWVNKAYPINANPNPNSSRRISFKNWWTGLQIHQAQNILEKMVLFWHNHLVTEDSVIEQSIPVYKSNELLRKYALGDFKQLINEITLDAGMLRYLNGERNTAKAPDENYGRELQELFCVGKGPDSQYTEDDVKAAAKVLTGWYVGYQEKDANNVNQNIIPKVSFNPNNHDYTDKNFSSFYKNTKIAAYTKPTDLTMATNAAKNEIAQMIDMILATDEVAKFICRKLWTFFVYYEITQEIEDNVITPLAELFRKDYQIKPVLKALFTSDYFFKEAHRGCMIKSPTDFVISQIRLFGFPIPSYSDKDKIEISYYYWNIMRNYILRQGQDLGDPPNVAGWPAYYQAPSFHEMWVDTATYPERKSMYEALAKNEYSTGTAMFLTTNQNIKIKTNFVDFVKKFKNPSDPNDLINEAIELMFGVTVSDNVKTQLKSNYLLLGQSSDYYWTDAYNTYVANPSTTDPEAKLVPKMLQDLFTYLQSAAEYHLC